MERPFRPLKTEVVIKFDHFSHLTDHVPQHRTDNRAKHQNKK